MLIIGHRGARNEAPENTVESFVHAQTNGCVHFELDIQLSSDLELVVYHDSSLKRTSGIKGLVRDLDSKDLLKTDARLNTPGWKHPCYIPRLQSVIDATPKTISWQLEVKPDTRARMQHIAIKLLDIVRVNDLKDKVTITSSSQEFLREVRSKSDLHVGLVQEFPYLNRASDAAKLGCKLLVLNQKIATPRRVQQAIDLGLRVSCWTINSVDRIIELERIGVDSFITDEPSKIIHFFSKKESDKSPYISS